jgi:hypothetical protein
MKRLTVIALVLLSSYLEASTREERAFLLNQEMEALLQAAAKPKIWRDGSLPPVDQRSGPSPSQIPQMENLEERFFSDNVRFQSARAMTSEEDSEITPAPMKPKLRARRDGTLESLEEVDK